jgi:hypothetical protein
MTFRTKYDDPKFGVKRPADDYEDMVRQVSVLRPDAYIEGSAGFDWMIMSRDNREQVGVARANPTTGKYWFRLLEAGSLPW